AISLTFTCACYCGRGSKSRVRAIADQAPSRHQIVVRRKRGRLVRTGTLATVRVSRLGPVPQRKAAQGRKRMVKLFFIGIGLVILAVVGAFAAVLTPLLDGVNHNLGGPPRSPFHSPIPQPWVDTVHG